MNKENENINMQDVNISPEAPVESIEPPTKIVVIHHTESNILEGNMKSISIHQILCEIYNKLFKLDMSFTKSLSRQHRNILIEALPIVTYGINHVKRENIQIFLKKVTNIDEEVENSDLSRPENKNMAQNLERIIFTDLQLCLSLYNYHLNRKSLGVFKRFAKFLYQPVDSLKTYLNDRKILMEVRRVFDIEETTEIMKFILSINKKIEEFLIKMGSDYSKNISKRSINSFDLAIYSAVKTQQRVFGGVTGVLNENFYQNMSLTNAKILVDEIDEIVFYDKQVKNNITLLSANDHIVPKSISELKEYSYKQYDELVIHEQSDYKKKFYQKAAFLASFFGLMLLLKFKKK